MDIINICGGLAAFVLIVFFLVAFIVHLYYFLGLYAKLAFYKPKPRNNVMPPVSVIVCARNEDDNIVELLPSVLEQQYPDFEVVVINDCSIDNTGDILEEMARRYPKLKIVTIKPDDYYSHGKKFALMVGIKGAKNNVLLLTDADCKPNSPNWIRNMSSHFVDKTEIVLGYGGYEKRKGLLNKLIRFDTFFIALQYLSFSLARITYMGVGRNLSYKKDLYFRHKGFASHYHIKSGDDDLFINEVARKNNVNVEVEIESFTISKVKRTWADWKRQKKRHITTARHYKALHRFMLVLFPASQWIFIGTAVALMVLGVHTYIILSVVFIRYFIQILIFSKAMKKLDERDLLPWIPFFEIFFMFFYPVVALSNVFQKKNRWS